MAIPWEKKFQAGGYTLSKSDFEDHCIEIHKNEIVNYSSGTYKPYERAEVAWSIFKFLCKKGEKLPLQWIDNEGSMKFSPDNIEGTIKFL